MMEKQKHTPGPWTIMKPKVFDADQAEDRLIISKTDGKPQHIAEVLQYRNEQNHNADGVALANARLIAAAPELLKELEGALNEICRLCVQLNPQHKDCQSCEDMAERKQAIVKAEGKK